MKVRPFTMKSGTGVEFYCPGCQRTHLVFTDRFAVRTPKLWQSPTAAKFIHWWNHDTERPTITPAVRQLRHPGEWFGPQWLPLGVSRLECEAHVLKGTIHFTHDSQHALRGQTVDMIDIHNKSDSH